MSVTSSTIPSPYVLGLDPSLSKTGYVVFDVSAPDDAVVEKGLLKTSTKDGILVQRLIKQASQVQEKILRYNIRFIGMEAPFFGANSTEVLYALNQYLHRVFLDCTSYVVCFPPQMLKKLVFPDVSIEGIGKPHMIDRAKTILHLHGQRLAEDVADAYWAGYFGKKFYRWRFLKEVKDEDLGEYERHVFAGKHTLTRGARKGVTDYTGIIYRENQLFFDFEAIKRRASNVTKEEIQEKIFRTQRRKRKR